MMAPGAILGLKSSLNLGLPDNLKYCSRARCEPLGQKQQSLKFTL